MEEDTNTSQSTRIDPKDSPSGERLDNVESFREYYKRLSNANSPEWDGPRRDENVTTTRDHTNLLDAIASSLELTPHQKDRASKLLSELPPRHFRGNKNVAVVLSLCGHVGRQDGRDYHPVHVPCEPDTLGSDSAQSFSRVARNSGIEYADLIGCWHRIGDEL